MAQAQASSLYNLTSRDNLDAYIQQYIQADESFLRSCQTTIDVLVSLLQNNVPAELRPSSVRKGGSLCKGTSIKGSSDIDLVLMLANYREVRRLKDDLPVLLRTLHSCLEQFPNVTVTGETQYSVQIEYTCKPGDTHDVDVLLAVDAIQTYGGVQNVYEAMRSRDSRIRGNYSACLVPLHAQLFGEINATKLKSLIRLVKFWKKDREKAYKSAHRGQMVARWPTSYVMEIVTLASWIQAGSPTNFDMRKAFFAVLKSIAAHHQFKIILEDRLLNYERHMIERSDSGPFIMDPCNPFNNLYLTAGQTTTWNWDAIAVEALNFLGRPLFHNVSGSLSSW